jgi:hypothetical protein
MSRADSACSRRLTPVVPLRVRGRNQNGYLECFGDTGEADDVALVFGQRREIADAGHQI